jgi:hypothetical protein
VKSTELIFFKDNEIKAVPLAGLTYNKREFTWRPKLTWWTGELKPLLDLFPTQRSFGFSESACRRCKASYVPFGRPGSHVSWCSTQCYLADRNDRRRVQQALSRPSRAKERPFLICGHCGCGVFPKRSDAKFCSANCRVKAHLSSKE